MRGATWLAPGPAGSEGISFDAGATLQPRAHRNSHPSGQAARCFPFVAIERKAGTMGVRVECDWCRQTIKPGEPYVTVAIDGKINQVGKVEVLSQPARVYCGGGRHEDDDPAAQGWNGGWWPRLSCAQRVLTALDGNPDGRVDAGLEWRLVPQAALRPETFVNGPVSDLKGLRPPVLKALEMAGVETIHDLASLTEAQWVAIRGVSRYGVEEIRKALRSYAYSRPKKNAPARTNAATESAVSA